MNGNSLADFITESGLYAAMLHKEALRDIGRELIATKKYPTRITKRYLIDQNVADLLKKLELIPISEFVAQFDRIVMPFDQM